MDNNAQIKIIKPLAQTQSNKIVRYQQINLMTGQIFEMNHNLIYFPYRHEIDDEGWGCAWRAIQMLLSSQQIVVSFQTLYEEFSQKSVLMQIIQSKQNLVTQQTINTLNTTKWSPAQIQCHWAQPFIASLVCLKNNIPYQLLLLNGKPFSYAPQGVFQRVINFTQLLNLIKKVIAKSCIMIDDGNYALSIIGLRQTIQLNIQLLFADPHIRSNKLHKTVGIYSKTYNKAGESLSSTQTSIQKQQSLYNVIDKLQFSTKNWMICFLDN